MYKTIVTENNNNFITIWLNRPEKRNSFNAELIEELTQVFNSIKESKTIKYVILCGKGLSFSAGADLNWMKSMKDYSLEENSADSKKLFDMFYAAYSIPQPLITLVHGHVYGGALGFLGVSDFIWAERKTKFCFSETKLGLSPAVISSFLLSKNNLNEIWPKMLFATPFDAIEAKQMKIIHKVYDEQNLEQELENFIIQINKICSTAVSRTKELLKSQLWLNPDSVKNQTIQTISELRVSDSAQSRMEVFFNK